MFQDSFLANLVLFVVGQVAAWGYLRTGLVVRGGALMVGLWVLADVALVARFAFADTGGVYLAGIGGMQAYAVFEFARFVHGRLRRRLRRVRGRRAERFRAAFLHYLRDELGEAEAIYRKLLWSDPWDLQSRLGLATALSRSGRRRPARRMLRSARSLDRDRRFHDVIRDELDRLADRDVPRRRPRRTHAEPRAVGAAQGSLGSDGTD